jgi:hypothetical protein
MRVLRALGLVLVGTAIGIGATTGGHSLRAAQGQRQDQERLDFKNTTYFARNVRFWFVQDKKTEACYLVGIDKDANAATSIAPAPEAACK